MSKPEETKPQEEEEWVDEVGAEEETKEEPVTTIKNSDVVVKYKKAATWANDALNEVIKNCKVGAKVGDLCKIGDETIKAKVATMFKGVEKGIGFPTCVSLNSCVCHNSPEEKDDEVSYNQVIKLGDVVHIDLGVHVEGYVAQVAHTYVVTADGDLVVDSKEANVITAAYEAVQTAIRGYRPDNSLYSVTDMIEGVAKIYNVNPVEGVLSHQVKQYIIDSAKCIPGKNDADKKVHNYNFEPATVWTLDVVFTTGKGKLKEKDTKTSVYKVALEPKHNSRIQAAAEVQKEVETIASTFPFAVRQLSHKRARLGLSELTRHDVMIPYPVLFEKEGEVVAHFKSTLFITDKKIERLTGVAPQKGGKKLALDADAELLVSAKAPMTFAKKEKKDEEKKE